MAGRRCVASLGGLALVLGACSAGEAATPPATTISSVSTSGNDLVGQPLGRTLLAYLDQLIMVDAACDPPPELPIAEPIADIALAGAVSAVFEAIDDARGSCDDPVAWTEAMSAVITAIDDLDRQARHGGDEAPHRYEGLPSTHDPVELGPFAVRALERLRHTLLARHPVGASSLWFSSQHLGLTSELRRSATDGAPPAVVVVGSSVGYRGIDTDVLGDALDTTVFNAGMVGASIAVVHEWLDELRAFGAGGEHVIWAMNTHELHECTGTGRMTKPSLMRDTAFEPLADGGGDRLDWIIGPVGVPVSASSPIGDDWLTRFADNDAALTETDPSVLARHRTELTRYRAPELCDSEMAYLATAVEEAARAGARVTIVSMPMHSDVTDAHPDGAAGHADALAELAELVGPSVEIIDYTDSLPDERFVDLFHVDARGRAEVTSELAMAVDGA